jgi:hypothetical protein
VAIILDGTNGIAAANVFGRNIIINGDGRINQRGYTSGTATSGANQYTLDRWRVVTSGQNLTFTGDDSGREMTAPAGGVEQVIEDKNISGGTYVLNWEGTATATVGGNAVAKGGTFTLTANTNATLRMIDGTFKNVQIEQGSVATPFERRPYGTELALCQRYFQVAGGAGSYPRVISFATANDQYIGGSWGYVTTMRASPTATQSGSWTYQNVVNSLTLSSTGTDGFLAYTTSNAGNVVIAGFFPADSTGKITFSAEL